MVCFMSIQKSQNHKKQKTNDKEYLNELMNIIDRLKERL